MIEYEEQLVVFASINAGFPVSDTVYVSRTAGVSESIDAQDLYIDDANVKLINVSNGSELHFYSLGNGRYYPIDITIHNYLDSVSSYWRNYIISSGTTYRLVVTHEDNSVIAETSVPEQIEITPEESFEFPVDDSEVIDLD